MKNNVSKATQLFLKNERLTTFFAKRWLVLSPSEIHEDILSEARIGLWKACLNYNDSNGIAFSTYASTVIDNQIKMFMRKVKTTVQTISFETEIADGITLEDALSYEQDFSPDIEALLQDGKHRCTMMLISGMTQNEIAAKLGYSQPHISRKLKRERKELLKALEVV